MSSKFFFAKIFGFTCGWSLSFLFFFYLTQLVFNRLCGLEKGYNTAIVVAISQIPLLTSGIYQYFLILNPFQVLYSYDDFSFYSALLEKLELASFAWSVVILFTGIKLLTSEKWFRILLVIFIIYLMYFFILTAPLLGIGM